MGVPSLISFDLVPKTVVLDSVSFSFDLLTVLGCTRDPRLLVVPIFLLVIFP